MPISYDIDPKRQLITSRLTGIVTDEDVFELARMFALRAEGEGQTIEVFRNRKQAEEWLGL